MPTTTILRRLITITLLVASIGISGIAAQNKCPCVATTPAAPLTVPADFFGMVWNTRANNPPASTLDVERYWDVGGTWAASQSGINTFTLTWLNNRITQYLTLGLNNQLFTLGCAPLFTVAGSTANCESIGTNNPPDDALTTDTAIKNLATALYNQSVTDGAKIQYWNGFNEPDIATFYNQATNSINGVNNINALVQIQKDYYATLKALDSTVTVVSPSPTGTGANAWWTKYRAAGGHAAGQYDVISLHSASTISATLTNYRAVRNQAITAGEGALPVFITEGNEGTAQTGSFTDRQKTAFVMQMYMEALNAGISSWEWYSYDNATIGILCTLSGSTCTGQSMAGTGYQTLHTWIKGATYFSNLVLTNPINQPILPCATDTQLVRRCVMKDSTTAPMQIIWSTTGNTIASVPTQGFTHQTDWSNTTTAAGSTITLDIIPIRLN